MAAPPVTALADEIEAQLAALGTPERAVQEQRYLKSDLRFLGASVPNVRKVATAEWRAHPELGAAGVLALAEALWAEPASAPVHERRAAAVELLELEAQAGRLGRAQVPLVERFLRGSKTWALVDNLSASVMGAIVVADPSATAVLDRWVADDDVWLRRSAVLTLLIPLRQGGGDWDRFCRYAERLAPEREFWVTKALGWVLRDTAKRRPDLVADWLTPRATRFGAVTIREAIKPLTAAQRAAIAAARARP